MLKSKFKKEAYFAVLPVIAILILPMVMITNIEDIFSDMILFIYMLFIFFSAYMFFVQLRTKTVAIVIEKKEVRIKSFLGLWKQTKLRLKDLDGYHTSVINAKGRNYNYLYLMQNGKKVARISNQFHSNFNELSYYFEDRLTNLGFIDTGFISELKDAVRF